ncbi:MAG: HAD family acid phosphatase [Ignavibacteria bacterium]|jgi:acid phosphatase
MKKTLITILLVSIIGCSPSLQNLSISKKEVQQYYDSGSYGLEMANVIDDAINKFNDIELTGKPAAVFDVDETTLSNYPYIKSINYGYFSEGWHKWVLQEDAEAILQTKKLYDYLVEKGVGIIFLTGRNYKEYNATLNNLKAQGYEVFDTLICRQKDELKLKATEYKPAKRKEMTEKGYNIIINVGDQWSDLEGGYSKLDIKLPNYLYMID